MTAISRNTWRASIIIREFVMVTIFEKVEGKYGKK